MKCVLALLAVIAICLASASCNEVKPSYQRIVGGSPTTIQRYPYAALIEQGKNFFVLWCGGSILTSNTILTAAHCFYHDGSLPASAFRIRVGSTYSGSGGRTFFLSTYVGHPDYDWNHIDSEGDIGIMRTWQDISFISGQIEPVALADMYHYLPDGTDVTTIGWGSTQPLQNYNPLRHVHMNTINFELCRERYSNIGYRVTDSMMCSGILNIGGKDSCQGDSGGPLLQGDIQVGINSWGVTCGDPYYPGVNVKVSYYYMWIMDTAHNVLQ